MKSDEPLVYCNGNWLPARLAGLPLHDAGFVFGATVTDLVRTFRHRPFRLDDHVRRFRRSCEMCHVPLQCSDSHLVEIATELAERNARWIPADGDLAIVMLATPGSAGLYLGEPTDGPPTLCLHTFALPFDRYRPLFQSGARLVIPPTRANPVVDPRAKQRSRMHWWIARHEARTTDPSSDALLLDASGCVTETASANLIAVFGQELVSPPANSILPGISLDHVRGLAEGLGLRFRTASLRPENCVKADELLLTCTTWCLAGVSRFDGHDMPWPGRVYQQLLSKWSNEVGVEIDRQGLISSPCL